MKRFLTVFFLCLALFVTGRDGFAKDRELPQTREQITLSFAPLVRQVSPAVVSIYTRRVVSSRSGHPFLDDPFFAPFFQDGFGGGLTRKHVENALGSGVIVQKDGLVVTNAHVIKGADEITVMLPDGRELEARVVLIDSPSDLALLRVDPQGQALPFVSLRPSESLEVGDLVLAIGNPFGVGQTVTSGIVSALARSSLNVSDFNFFIQTDAAINPGNSGGPLVSMDGGVVGINTAIYSRSGGSMGLGFAIPSEMVATIIAAESAGHVSERGIVRGWLGAGAQEVSADVADSLGLERPQGVLLTSLHKASPLAKAGLVVGDVLLSVNGRIVRDPAEMKFRMAMISIGDTVEIGYFRKGKTLQVEVSMIAPPEDPPRDERTLEGGTPLDGARIANMNPAVAAELGLSADEESGVVVTGLEKRSAATRLLSVGDRIYEINNESVESTKDVEKILDVKRSQRGWLFVLGQSGRRRTIILR